MSFGKTLFLLRPALDHTKSSTLPECCMSAFTHIDHTALCQAGTYIISTMLYMAAGCLHDQLNCIHV